jgi:pimeloyl-ACP methyl ester carboxylesterase
MDQKKMKHVFLLLIVALPAIVSCQKEKITIGTNVSETFYVENNGASMRVLVEGNTSGRVFIVFVHGGPGAGAYIYNTDYMTNNIEDKYAIVYWDERNSGASQGSSNGRYLTLEQMTDDLKKVIQVIKVRYGMSSEVFILGHSFGGLLTSSFMTTGNNQQMVKGWIFADGSHNYPLNDTLTRQMLISVGQQQIALNNNKARWEEIVSYCKTHTGNFSLYESDQMEKYAEEAESYINGVTKVDIYKLFSNNAVKYNWPLTSMLMNYLFSSEAAINKDLATTEFSSSLDKVTVPVLILFGEYDFVCPVGLGYDLMSHISSTDKKIVISSISGHSIMFQDEVLFCNEVNEFISLHR